MWQNQCSIIIWKKMKEEIYYNKCQWEVLIHYVASDPFSLLKNKKLFWMTWSLCNPAMAAFWFGRALWVTAGSQLRISSFSDFTLSKLHGCLKPVLQLLDILQHADQLGMILHIQAVVFRRVGLQVKQQRRVVILQEGDYLTVRIWRCFSVCWS